MYGLILTKDSPRAEFLSERAAESAIRKLAFIAKAGMRARHFSHYSRGELKGYHVQLGLNGDTHFITEADVDRYVG